MACCVWRAQCIAKNTYLHCTYRGACVRGTCCTETPASPWTRARRSHGPVTGTTGGISPPRHIHTGTRTHARVVQSYGSACIGTQAAAAAATRVPDAHTDARTHGCTRTRTRTHTHTHTCSQAKYCLPSTMPSLRPCKQHSDQCVECVSWGVSFEQRPTYPCYYPRRHRADTRSCAVHNARCWISQSTQTRASTAQCSRHAHTQTRTRTPTEHPPPSFHTAHLYKIQARYAREVNATYERLVEDNPAHLFSEAACFLDEAIVLEDAGTAPVNHDTRTNRPPPPLVLKMAWYGMVIPAQVQAQTQAHRPRAALLLPPPHSHLPLPQPRTVWLGRLVQPTQAWGARQTIASVMRVRACVRACVHVYRVHRR